MISSGQVYLVAAERQPAVRRAGRRTAAHARARGGHARSPQLGLRRRQARGRARGARARRRARDRRDGRCACRWCRARTTARAGSGPTCSACSTAARSCCPAGEGTRALRVGRGRRARAGRARRAAAAARGRVQPRAARRADAVASCWRPRPSVLGAEPHLVECTLGAGRGRRARRGVLALLGAVVFAPRPVARGARLGLRGHAERARGCPRWCARTSPSPRPRRTPATPRATRARARRGARGRPALTRTRVRIAGASAADTAGAAPAPNLTLRTAPPILFARHRLWPAPSGRPTDVPR